MAAETKLAIDGAAVRKRRNQLFLTIAELAARCGCSVRTVRRVESGLGCHAGTARRLAKGLRCSFCSLLAPEGHVESRRKPGELNGQSARHRLLESWHDG